MDYDKTDIPQTYKQGRDLGPAMTELWMNTVASHVDARTVRWVLDLGCGTGRFSQALAKRFDAVVIGLDPSGKMLAEAQRDLNRARVFYSCGFAEALPLASDSIDLVFISMVFHHFKDPQAVARECRRILRKNGRLCLRTASREKIPLYPYVPYFPTSTILLEQRIPALAFQCEVFQAASFQILFCGNITQQIATDYSAYADKLALKADSILVSLADEEFEAGIAALRREKPAGPITEPIDFVVFQK
jgi:ubiquinone/menaquinone biosynthesis C-methylase UbiE